MSLFPVSSSLKIHHSNQHSFAQIAVDTAENESSKVSSFFPTQAVQLPIDIPPVQGFGPRGRASQGSDAAEAAAG